MLNDKKTIFALATPPGKSGVAIIRISGPKAFNTLKTLTLNALPNPRNAVLRDIIHPTTKELIDKAVILTYHGPKSFTGEDVVELHIHGSRAIINILMSVLSNISDLRLSEPGEFSKRAFLNGKMDLTSAEGLADLIDSETIIQQKQAIRQMQGDLANLYDNWKKQLIKILALIEAYIDFPDEDIPDDVIWVVENEVNNLKQKLSLHLSDSHKGEVIRRGIYVAIIGSPNVGKSSLLNYLAKREVAIVSNIAGTTRDVIEVHLDLGGYPVTIADTAGIRESNNLIEIEGISRAKTKAEISDIKIILLSADDPESYNLEIKSIIDDNTIVLLNKIDRNIKLDIDNAIKISVKENIGMEKFLKELTSFIAEKFSPSSEPIITRERHRYYIKKSLESLEYFSLSNYLELACEDLRLAGRALGHIVGTIEVETILDEVFSNFCIGK